MPADLSELEQWVAATARAALTNPSDLAYVSGQGGTFVFYVVPRDGFPTEIRECVLRRDAAGVVAMLRKKGWKVREFVPSEAAVKEER